MLNIREKVLPKSAPFSSGKFLLQTFNEIIHRNFHFLEIPPEFFFIRLRNFPPKLREVSHQNVPQHFRLLRSQFKLRHERLPFFFVCMPANIYISLILLYQKNLKRQTGSRGFTLSLNQ